MKKIFSFFVALMATTVMASAMEIAVPATTLDLQEPTMVTDAGWAGEVAYYLDDDVLVTSGQESRLSFENQTWITKLNTGSSNNTWDALAPFKGSEFYSNKAYATLQAGRYTAYLVTGCDSVWVYGYNNANTGKYLIMDVYEIAGEVATINTDETAATYSVNDEAAGKANVVLKQALDATKKYLVVTTGAGASNSRVFEIAFFRHSDVAKTYWTVAGSSEVAFGTAWAPANKANDMVKQEDGSYKWEKTELELAAGEIAFKVCKDHAWTEAYPASDYKLQIDAAGIYTITITFEPENENKVSAVATKTGEAVVLPTVVLHGNFFGDWKDTDPFAPAEDKLTARLNLTLAEGNYEFGFKFDGAWKANGANITREAPTTSLADGSGNMHFAADAAGEYQLTYTFESQTLEVVYPKKPEVLPEGAFKLTFNGTGEAGKDASAAYGTEVEAIFDAASALYVASVETATKVYAGRPIADDNSSLKFGTSKDPGSLAFTLATPVEVDSIIVNATQYGNNAAKVTVNGVEFNLTAGNKVPTDCKITPEGKVSAITIEQTGSERIYLRYITVYAKTSTTPGKEGYALLVNGTDLIDLTHGEEYEGYDQWFVEGAALKAGDVVKVHNYATEASWAIGILNPASSKHVANSEDGLVFDKDGEYTIYLKLKFEADEIYVAPLPDEGGDEPGEKIENPIFTVIVPEGTDSVFVAGSFDEWASFRKLSAVEGKDNQFTIQIEGEFEAIEYKYLAGPDWKYVEVREGDANRTFVVDALDEVSAWTSVPEGGEEPPTPGKEGYALLVNGTDLIDLTHGEEYEGYDQWFVEGAALKAGDVVKVHSYETEASWAIGILNPASSKHVANSEEGLVFDQDGEYTIYLKLKFEADEIYVAPLADEGGDPVLTDGYYLVGSFSDWKAAAENLFVANPDAEGEYQLAINLTAGDEIKVAYVVADVLTEWFPKEGNYIVDANHSGPTTMYFRPDYKEEWAAFGGYFYIVPTSTEGIEETLSEGKAVKVLHEGKLLIMKGNHSYTPMGQIVK